MKEYKNIIIEHFDRIVLVRLNRPKSLNALNTELIVELLDALIPLDKNNDIGCFIITGNEKVFSVGADIRELNSLNTTEMYCTDYFSGWDKFAALRTPKIAAVSGYALDGGCELAMMCDIIFAAECAKFGQPELKIGCIPGMGGSQRLTRLVGRAKAMDMILTARTITSDEALQYGLASRIIPDGELIYEAIEAAKTIASFSKPSVMMARETVSVADKTELDKGLQYERRLYFSAFATEDKNEGMNAFLEKRPPKFSHK